MTLWTNYEWHPFPHETRPGRHQQQFRVNVWAGLIGDIFIGPYVLPSHLTGADYGEFLVNTLPDLMDDVPLAVRWQMWFMHDGAPAHFSHVVREHLNNVFPRKWIGVVLWTGHHVRQTLIPLTFTYGVIWKRWFTTMYQATSTSLPNGSTSVATTSDKDTKFCYKWNVPWTAVSLCALL